jgi:hypothetical protein
MANGTSTTGAANTSFAGQNQGSSSVGDVVTALKGVTSQLSSNGALLQQLISILGAAFPRIIGTFTMPAANTAIIPNTGVQANAGISFTALNASATALMGSSKQLYVSSISPGVSFTVNTGDGTNAAGTEIIQYQLTNPI